MHKLWLQINSRKTEFTLCLLHIQCMKSCTKVTLYWFGVKEGRSKGLIVLMAIFGASHGAAV